MKNRLFTVAVAMMAWCGAAWAQSEPVIDLRANEGLTYGQEMRWSEAGRESITTILPLSQPESTVANAQQRIAPAQCVKGAIGFSASWNGGTQFGIYTISLADDGSIVSEALNDECNANAGAVYRDGKYYVTRWSDFFGYKRVRHFVFDATTGQTLSFTGDNFNETDRIATDLALDYATGVVYGCFYNTTATGYQIATLNLDDWTVTTIRNIPAEDRWNACAVHPSGKLYAITMAGDLVMVDKNDGTTVKVGPTGLTPGLNASGAIDQRTGVFYYNYCPDEFNTYLYSIDVATGHAEMLRKLPGDEVIYGMYVPEPLAADKAPDQVANFVAQPDATDGAMRVDVSFTMPTTLYDGTAPTAADCHWRVTVDDQQAAEGAAVWGQTVTVTVSLEGKEPGVHRVAAAADNERGSSPDVWAKPWVGPDYPKAVAEVTIEELQDGKFAVEWTPVSECVNGGFFRADEVRYTVVRYPGSVTVAESTAATQLTDDPGQINGITTFSYAVRAEFRSMASDYTMSNLITKGNIVPPYEQTFDTEDDFGLFSIVNCNGGTTWSYDGGKYGQNCAQVQFDSNGMDDWLFTPAINLEEGKSYEFSVEMWVLMENHPETFEIMLGTAASPEAMTTTLVSRRSINNTERVKFTATIIPPVTGVYYIGAHACSEPNTWYIYLDNLTIAAPKDSQAPAQITDLAVLPDGMGLPAAKVTATAPTLTINGAELTSLNAVKISRDGELIATISPVAPGQSIEYNDRTVRSIGVHTWSMVAVNDDGESVPAECSAVIGVCTPSAPLNVKIKETEEPGTVTVSWDAPTVDVNGNSINPSMLLYTVAYVGDDGSTRYATKQTRATSFTFKAIETVDHQEMIYAGVLAFMGNEMSEYTYSDMIPVGLAYDMPYEESFANATVSSVLGSVAVTGNARWRLATDRTIPDITSVDGDNGYIYMQANTPGDAAELFTGKITIEGYKPMLTLWYYSVSEYDRNVIAVSVVDGDEVTKVDEFNCMNPCGWYRRLIPLEQWSERTVQLRIYARTEAYTVTMIDDLRLEWLPDADLTAVAIEAPVRVTAGEPFEVAATVTNGASLPATAYTATLLRNGQPVATRSDLPTIEPAETVTIALTDCLGVMDSKTNEYVIVVDIDGDVNTADNTTTTAMTMRFRPFHPAPEALTAVETAEGAVLSWEAPDYSMGQPRSVTDDLENESYELFTISDFGPWKLVNRNASQTVGFAGSAPYAHAQEAMAYQLFGIEESGLTSNEWRAHSGNRLLIAPQALSEANNGWLISPELSGSRQVISFWAKTLNYTVGLEQFEFLVSSSDNELRNFTAVEVEDYDEGVPAAWMQYHVLVPEGTRYFAIRCVSDHCFVFALDDLTYAPAGAETEAYELSGYRVYRDGELVASVAADATGVTDTEATIGSHTWSVTALYTAGESRPAECTADLSSAADAAVDAARITTVGHDIVIAGAAGQPASIVTPAGATLWNTKALPAGATSVRVAPGIYIVSAGSTVSKVVVR